MKQVLASILVLMFILSCDFDKPPKPLSPFQCRVTGVAVQDGDTVSGTIIEAVSYTTIAEVQAACQSPFEYKAGCTIALSDKTYKVVYIRTFAGSSPLYNTPKNHEYCHAYYEEWEHI